MQGMKSLHEVAVEWNVSTRTVRNWIAQGLIVAYKRNNHAILIDERSLDGILKPIKGAR
jgi:predicted site-specific integrase-resolvase